MSRPMLVSVGDSTMLTNRINSVTVRNFRSLADVAVDLEDLTVLVGANGSGKTNFLEVLRFTRDVIRNGLDSALSDQGNFIGIQRNTTLHSFPEISIELRLTLEGQEAFYSFTLGKDEKYGIALSREVAKIGNYEYELPQKSESVNFTTSSFNKASLPASFPNNL